MKTIRIILFLIVGLVLIVGCIGMLIPQLVRWGEDKPPAEYYSLFLVARSVRHFSEENSSRAPTNWNQILRYTDFPGADRALLEKGKPLIEESFVFLPYPLTTEGWYKGTVIVAGVKSVKTSSRRVRYLVCQGSDGVISDQDVDEVVFQNMLGQAGKALPAPDPEVVSKARAAAEAALAEKRR